MCIYPIGGTNACQSAVRILENKSIPIIDHPSPDVTHLMLDVPSFQSDGHLRCGDSIEPILRMLPPNIKIIGGNLNTPSLSHYSRIDLLTLEDYLAKNAAITADCAIRLVSKLMSSTFFDSPALIIGWGRIGKCLSRKLLSLGCPTTIAVRSAKDQAILNALGYSSISAADIPVTLHQYALLFNTVPHTVVNSSLPPDILAVELASTPGIPKSDSIDGRGLPEKLAPVSSGKLIAETILKLIQEDVT